MQQSIEQFQAQMHAQIASLWAPLMPQQALMREQGWAWLAHVPVSKWPELQATLQQKMALAFSGLTEEAALSKDKRFSNVAYQQTPYYRWLKTVHQLHTEFLHTLLSAAALPPLEHKRAQFFVQQFCDSSAPTNTLWGNPSALKAAIESQGNTLVEGYKQLQADIAKQRISMSDESAFEVGKNLAITQGEVVYRNPLIELIQYAPTTTKVYQKPLLIVPPCINKFYILDMQPDNSFVRHAVAEGHTVFIISWRNVPKELGTLTWDDYLSSGVLQAIEVVQSITGQKSINALGFCVGGTLLAASLAVLAARGEDDKVASVTLLTTLLDFNEPGEIGAYLSESILNAREAQFMQGERMRGQELADVFASLRANDLVWSFVVNNYLHGKRPKAFDLLFWNSDSTNLPGPMYVYYQRQFYLRNLLCQPNKLKMLGEDIDLTLLSMPKYVVASREDHIVPWRSAHASAQSFADDALTFVVGGSGHIAGIVNPPAKKARGYVTGDFAVSPEPDGWEANTTAHEGSWWPHWYLWLAKQAGKKVAARTPGSHASFPSLGAAPGTYVLEKS